ncbi:hypothetical protein L195_g061321, partial [Trifolium pratense]
VRILINNHIASRICQLATHQFTRPRGFILCHFRAHHFTSLGAARGLQGNHIEKTTIDLVMLI